MLAVEPNGAAIVDGNSEVRWAAAIRDGMVPRVDSSVTAGIARLSEGRLSDGVVLRNAITTKTGQIP